MDFINLDLPQLEYDGIFANATIFHTPRQEIDRVMRELNDSLKKRGVLFCSILEEIIRKVLVVNDTDSIMTGIHGNKYVWIQVLKK